MPSPVSAIKGKNKVSKYWLGIGSKNGSMIVCTLQIYTAGNGTHVKNVKVTSICRRYYNVEV